jgi:tripartite-type tricarboxylate transporter receptor subunit TctC
MSRSRCGGFAVALALALPPLHWQAHADNYPSRPVTIIVSLAAGTGMDTLVRLYGEKLSQHLGQPVVIDNRPGGAGVVAGETIAKGPSDGYTLAVATSAVMAIRPTLFKQRPFDPLTDFVPISHYVKSPFFARRDTPREIVDRLHGEMHAVMATPEMQQKILAIGLIPHESPSVEGIQRYIKAETEKWGALVRQLGLEGSQ